MPTLDWSLLLRTPAFETTSLLLGLVVGSFLNVCIHRLPREHEPAAGPFAWAIELGRQLESLVHPPSRCPSCGRGVRPWDNVPLLSFVLLRGRCRDCGAAIAWRYPAVEAANGLLWLALAVLRGPALPTLVAMLLASALLALSLIDLEHQLLPDAITLPGIALGLVASFLPGSALRPPAAAAAAAGGWLAFALVALAWKKLRGLDALGEGDWKLAALLGACLGWERLLLTVLLASAAGALAGALILLSGRGGWRTKLPLGTFLGASGIAMVLWGDRLVSWHRTLQAWLAEWILSLGLLGG
jgi:leader peptidase (prepilin peptidase)/N-methyltransferase